MPHDLCNDVSAAGLLLSGRCTSHGQKGRMRRHLQIVCAGLLVGALVLAVACGGGGGEGEKQTSIKPAEADLLVSNPSGALGASAGKFEDEVDSVEGEFTLEMKIGDVSVGAAGT